MAFVTSSHPFIAALIRAFGLEQQPVRKITVTAAYDDVVTVKVTRLVEAEKGERFVQDIASLEEPYRRFALMPALCEKTERYRLADDRDDCEDRDDCDDCDDDPEAVLLGPPLYLSEEALLSLTEEQRRSFARLLRCAGSDPHVA